MHEHVLRLAISLTGVVLVGKSVGRPARKLCFEQLTVDSGMRQKTLGRKGREGLVMAKI